MKKIIAIILAATMLMLTSFCLMGCDSDMPLKKISCQDVIDAYSKYSQYTVEHIENTFVDNCVCEVKVSKPDGDYVMIRFYDSVQNAKKGVNKYNIFVWFIAVIYGESRWLETDYYGNLVYESFDKELLKPLFELINS